MDMSTATRLLTAEVAVVAVAAGIEDFETAFWPLFLVAFRAAHRVLGDRHAAEDVAADALTEAHLRWSRIAGLSYRDAWVVRVATNRALDVLRRNPPPTTIRLDAHFEEGSAVRLSLVRELRELPRRQREVVVLRFLVGLPLADVAAVLGIGPASVHTHLARGMKRLRDRLGTDIGDTSWP
jgi:RNA polymerase sigma factor (sigma-70 family)